MIKKPLKSMVFWCFCLATLASCISKEELSVQSYYDYDKALPLEDSITFLSDSLGYQLYGVEFTSVHNKRVSGLLSIPKNDGKPLPVIILLHGLGDRKTVDYIDAGNQFFIENGYAVFRIDIDNHGVRKTHDYEFSLTNGYRFWTRDIISQTVFDLRRSIDFLSERKEIDKERIGYYGISLGGIIGTIFCGVDDRVKVPIIALAGGNLNLMFGLDALSQETKEFFSIIDPINFVEDISPRPLLMLNAANDEIVLPITSKLLFKKAEQPKEIIWYEAKHRDVPLEKVYNDGINWYKKYL